MTTHGEATAAPVDLQLGGITYRMSPLTGTDIAELENWLQSEAIRRVRESLEGASSAEYDRAISAAIAGAASLSLASSRGAEMFATVSGLSRMLWQGIHHNHPDIDVATIQQSLFSAEALSSSELALEQANRFTAAKKKSAPKKTKTKHRKKNRRSM